jgi:hypothetical protein
MDGKLQPSVIFPSLSSLLSQIEFAWGGDDYTTGPGFSVNHDNLHIGIESRVYSTERAGKISEGTFIHIAKRLADQF